MQGYKIRATKSGDPHRWRREFNERASQKEALVKKEGVRITVSDGDRDKPTCAHGFKTDGKIAITVCAEGEKKPFCRKCVFDFFIFRSFVNVF